MTDSALRLPRQVYRLRTFGLALGFLSVGAVFYERGASPLAWGLLTAHGLVWPHVAWYRARMSVDPHGAERLNLLVDSAVGGVYVPLMAFALLPSVLIVALLSMDKLGWGWRFLGRALGGMAATGAATTVLTGASLRPDTSMRVIAASIPLMVAYPFAVALISERSGRLARERRKAVEQTAALREQLAHIARVGTLGEMAAGMAHELNQPLTAIHLEAHTALETDPAGIPEDVRSALSSIAELSLRAGDIVRRMRTFARRGQAHREPIPISQLVHEVLALLDHDLRLGAVEIVLLLRDDLPPVLVDRIEIQQVLVNLIRNAIEAMTGPAVALRRLTIRTGPGKECVRVTVSDTGGGVDPAILAHLFHPFQTTKAAGLGLGLSICQSLIEANGGRVGAGPHPTGGAMFYFEVPTAPAERQS